MHLSDAMDHAGIAEDTLRCGGFPGIDVCRDTKVPLEFEVSHVSFIFFLDALRNLR